MIFAEASCRLKDSATNLAMSAVGKTPRIEVMNGPRLVNKIHFKMNDPKTLQTRGARRYIRRYTRTFLSRQDRDAFFETAIQSIPRFLRRYTLRSVTFFVTIRNLAASALLTAFGGYTFAFHRPSWSFESGLESALVVDQSPVLKVNNSMLSRRHVIVQWRGTFNLRIEH